MLIKSKPRGPVGPMTDFSCQNVFYMADNVKKRPISAPVQGKTRRQMIPRKPVCAIKKPKRVLQGNFKSYL